MPGSAADSDESRTDKSGMSVPEEESVCYCPHKYHQGETSQSEAPGDKKMAPPVASLATDVGNINTFVHHIRMRHETLIRLPCKQV